MSCEIVYDRRFIKTTRGIIPMILAGSSNCTEWIFDRSGRNREIMAKSWYVMQEALLEVPREQIIAWADGFDQAENYKLFRFRSAWVRAKQGRKWMENGCDAAQSLEDYLAWNHGLSLYCALLINRKDKFNTDTELSTFCRTTEALEGWIDTARARKAEILTAEPETAVRLHIGFAPDKPLRNIPTGNLMGRVVVKYRDSYVTSYVTRKELHFTRDPQEAYVFDSLEIAKEEIGPAFKVQYVKAENALATKNYTLRFTQGILRGQYLGKVTKAHLRGVCKATDATRYPHAADAIRAAKKIRSRFSYWQTGTIMLCNIAEETETPIEESKLTETKQEAVK